VKFGVRPKIVAICSNSSGLRPISWACSKVAIFCAAVVLMKKITLAAKVGFLRRFIESLLHLQLYFMRIVVQRVLSASVTIDEKVVGSIGQGLMLLVGIEDADTREDADWLVNKISQLRIFSDSEGKMNLDLKSIDGKVLIVSQFTLHASYKKGNRPSFLRAANPEKSIPLYEYFISTFKNTIGDDKVETGEFGAMMDVALVNHGPVTILMDSLNRE